MPARSGSTATLSPGDLIRIAVYRNPELSGDFAIGEDGSIVHPLYRTLRAVTGVPMADVELRLRRFIGEFTKADSLFVAVPLLRITVSGDVRTPNVYRLPPETSLSQAIAVAGGQTERARRDRALLIRDGRETQIDLRGVAPMAQALIRSGDQIAVERERSTFRDWVLPTVTLFGSIAAIINVVLYNHR
jgi:polysaccharide export outer membrane protein